LLQGFRPDDSPSKRDGTAPANVAGEPSVQPCGTQKKTPGHVLAAQWVLARPTTTEDKRIIGKTRPGRKVYFAGQDGARNRGNPGS